MHVAIEIWINIRIFREYVCFLDSFDRNINQMFSYHKMLFQETFSGPCISKTIRAPCFEKFIIGERASIQNLQNMRKLLFTKL